MNKPSHCVCASWPNHFTPPYINPSTQTNTRQTIINLTHTNTSHHTHHTNQPHQNWGATTHMKLCHFPSALCTSTHESQKMVLCNLTSYVVVCPSLSYLPIFRLCIHTHQSHNMVFSSWSLVVVGICLFCSHVQSTLLTYMWVQHTHTPTQVTPLCLSVGVWWWLGYASFTSMHNQTLWT